MKDDLAQRVIDAFGGLTAMHRASGMPITTIASWRTRKIPSWRFHAIREAAAKENVNLPKDFPND